MKHYFRSLFLSNALLMFATGCQTPPAAENGSRHKSGDGQAPSPSLAGTNLTSGRITTASGLQYKVLESGPAEGRAPTIGDFVSVHYRGTLTDGTVFDSSLERGQPVTFGVGQVIPGWTEALQLMKPGDNWLLFIPAHLAYGNQAMGNKIPANSDLIFQVALLQVSGR